MIVQIFVEEPQIVIIANVMILITTTFFFMNELLQINDLGLAMYVQDLWNCND